MTDLERTAWWEIAAAALASIGYGVLFAFYGPHVAFAALSFMALPTLAQIGRRRKPMDERDRAISARSALIGYGVFWLTFVGGALCIWAYRRGEGTIPVDILPLFPMAGLVVFSLVRSVATLAQYARGR